MLLDQIKVDMTAALKAGETLRLSVLRMLVSAIGYKAIDVGRALTDAEVLEVIGREVKKRKEAMVSYQGAGRKAQEDQERAEMEILVKYLPTQMDENEIRAKIAEFGNGDFATLMKKAMGELKGRADGAVVARIVKEMVDA